MQSIAVEGDDMLQAAADMTLGVVVLSSACRGGGGDTIVDREELFDLRVAERGDVADPEAVLESTTDQAQAAHVGVAIKTTVPRRSLRTDRSVPTLPGADQVGVQPRPPSDDGHRMVCPVFHEPECIYLFIYCQGFLF